MKAEAVLASSLLQSARLRLVALTDADVPIIARWHQDPLFLRLFDARAAKPRTEVELTEWLHEQHRSTTAFVFGIRLVSDDTLIGYVEIDGVLWAHQTAWLAYCIGEAAQQRKGYGTEAVRLALQFAFDELNLHRMQATVFSYNQPSMQLLTSVGFQREGVYREFLQRDGQRHDMYLFGLLRHEWEAGRNIPNQKLIADG